MKSRSTYSVASFLSVLDTAEKLESPRSVHEEKIGGQILHVVGNEIVYKSSDEKDFGLPPSASERFKALVTFLALNDNDDINKKSTNHGYTLLMAAVIHDHGDLITLLLNHGADPSICDADNDNAFLHAAKKNNSAALREFLTLIRTQEIENKKNAVVDLKDEAVAPSDLNHFQKNAVTSPVHHTTARSAEVVMDRIQLDPDVLLHKNKSGQTAAAIIDDYLKKNPPKTPASVRHNLATPSMRRAPQSQAIGVKKPDDALTSFSTLVDILHASHPLPTSVPILQALKPLPEDDKKKIELKVTPDAAYAQKLQAATHVYDKFFTRKFQHHTIITKKITLKYADLESARKREALRQQAVANEEKPSVIPDYLIPPAMPAHYKDQACVKAVLDLLKDYYAPESAPLLKSSRWYGLRRILTFHTGRHYCNDAQALHKQLRAMPLATAENITDIFATVNTKLKEIRQLPHDQKDNNSIFNSSYVRRLSYMREMLKTTGAYLEFVNNPVADGGATYLSSLDLNYSAMGLLNSSASARPRL